MLKIKNTPRSYRAKKDITIMIHAGNKKKTQHQKLPATYIGNIFPTVIFRAGCITNSYIRPLISDHRRNSLGLRNVFGAGPSPVIYSESKATPYI